MKWWQAYATAQMAAGAVWADRYHGFWAHQAAQAMTVVIGIAVWRLLEAMFEPRHAR